MTPAPAEDPEPCLKWRQGCTAPADDDDGYCFRHRPRWGSLAPVVPQAPPTPSPVEVAPPAPPQAPRRRHWEPAPEPPRKPRALMPFAVLPRVPGDTRCRGERNGRRCEAAPAPKKAGMCGNCYKLAYRRGEVHAIPAVVVTVLDRDDVTCCAARNGVRCAMLPNRAFRGMCGACYALARNRGLLPPRPVLQVLTLVERDDVRCCAVRDGVRCAKPPAPKCSGMCSACRTRAQVRGLAVPSRRRS